MKAPGCAGRIFGLQNALKVRLKGLREMERDFSKETVYLDHQKALPFCFSSPHPFAGQGRRVVAKDGVGGEGMLGREGAAL